MAFENELTTAPEPRPDMAPQRGPGDMPFFNPEEGTFIPKIPGSGPASPTRRTRGLLDLKTDLKSLKFQDFGVSPAVVKDINNPPKYNSLSTPITRRTDDLVRVTKFIASANGVKFLTNQAALSKIGNEVNVQGNAKSIAKGLLKKLKQGGIDTAKVAGSILAQVPVSGTGTHFIRGFGGYAYLEKGESKGGALQTLISNVAGFTGDVQGSATVLAGNNVEFNRDKVDEAPGSLLDLYTNGDEESGIELSKKGVKKAVTNALKRKAANFLNKRYGTDYGIDGSKNKTAIRPADEPEFSARDQLKEGDYGGQVLSSTSARLYNVITETDKTVRLKLGDQGVGKNNITIDRIDRLNELEVRSTSILTNPQFGIGSTPQDIIPFEFNIITPETKTGTYNLENFLYFRAHLNSFADNFTGNWNSTKYIGRAEPVYTYDGFDRQVSFGFKMAAFTKEELLPLYHKLNFLVSSTSPTYDEAGAFMRGTYAKLTIGDYLTDVPGFFGSVNVTWEVAYPWEIGIDEEGNESNLPRVPHVLNIDCSFTPIHSFIPSVNGQFILNDTYKVGVPRTLGAPAAANLRGFTGLTPRPPTQTPVSALGVPRALTNPFG